MRPRDKVDTKKLFDLDSEVSDDDQMEEDPNKNNKYESEEDRLYEQNLQKYISYLNEFADKAKQAEKQTYCDGVTYVNHPLIDITQINYEKNIGFFDILDVEKPENRNILIKTMTVFTFLDNQVNKVVQILQSTLYDSLLMYGQIPHDKEAVEQGELMTARIFPIYKKIFYLVKKIISFIENLIIQLHSMINKKHKLYKTHFKGLNLDFGFNIIGRALRAIYIIDCIVMNNPQIEEHWQQYKRMIKLARKQPEKFNTTALKLKKLEKIMSKFQNTVISKRCMETIMEINFDKTIEMHKLPVSNIRSNKELREYMEEYLDRTLDNIEKNLGTVTSSFDEEKRLLDVLCVFSFYKKLFPSEEFKDFWKKAWSFQKQIPIISAHSFVCVYISQFMLTLCPISKKPTTMDPKDPKSHIKSYIERLDKKIGSDFVNDYTNFCVWLSRMESFTTSNNSLKNLNKQSVKAMQQRFSNRIFILFQGVSLIYRLNKLIYLCLILHINQQAPINKKLIGNLILGMQSLKATANIIKKKADAFDTTVLLKILARDMLIIIDPIYKQVYAEYQKKRQEFQQRKSALKLLIILLNSPLSELKISMIKYILYYLENKNVLKKDQLIHLIGLLNKLQVIAYHQIMVQKYQSFDYLYYCKDILPIIFQWKRQNPNTCKRLQFLFDSFEDSAYLLKKCHHLINNNQLFEEYRKYILTQFQNHYMLPLKRKVQDFLRINIHCMLIQKLDGVNPYREEMSDLMKLVQFEKIRIFDTIVDLQIQITKSFNQTFYNMNTINIYDMETYEQMRVMANYLFGLKLHDVYLPNQTISQGNFNIFNILRNIPTFISAYKYNLLSQKFLEITAQSKMVSSVGIEQISDSIRTHGTGILSTTVNAFYRYLTQKMQAFNKFFFSDQMKSSLIRERKWYKHEQQRDKDHECMYPVERARKLYSQIKKMAKFEDESNLLDQLRDIITCVGNSLGFIRLIRSASLNFSSNSIKFLPTKVQLSESLEEIAGNAQLSDTTKYACKQLDDILKSLQDTFSDKIDYLNLMIKLFAKLDSRENDHLESFYIIIPALSLNFVEEMARGKEQITKKFSSRAFIYDDGLVLGIAYFLSLLRQNLQYKTLQWSTATAAYIQSSKNYSKAVEDMSSHSAKFREDMNIEKQLQLRKIQLMEQQFNFFNYNLISSNVLFKHQVPSIKDPTSPPTTTETAET